MENFKRILLLLTGLLILLASLGCGSSSPQAPLTQVASTPNPLVAQYNITHFHSGLTAWVEFGADTTYGRQTSVVSDSDATSGPSGDVVSILVAGMKAKTTYHMRAHVAWDGGSWVDQDQTFTTGAIPSTQSPPALQVSTPTPGLTPAPGVELLSLVSQSGASLLNTLALDLQGNVIWYCPQAALPVKPLPNGHYILNLIQNLQEIDLACNTIRNVSIGQVNQSLQANGYSFTIIPKQIVLGGGPFHHDVLVLPNGHWIALCETTKTFTDLPGYPGTIDVVGDALLDIDPNNNVVWAWSAFDHLDVNRHLFGLPDWTHSNAIVYTPDGNLMLSMRNQSWILKIDYANGSGAGDVLWRLGNGGDFTIAGGDLSQWFYSQHDPNIVVSNGPLTELAIWDNGNWRTNSSGTSPCGPLPPAPCYSRATLFQIDESTSLATLIWNDAPGFFSWWGGSIGVLSNNNVEFDMSEPFDNSASQIMEVTQDANPMTVWQLNITGGNAYRGFRVPSLYPGVTWEK